MSSVVFTLQVPAEAPFRSLASEVAARYLEISGGTAPAVSTMAGEVARLADAMATDGAEDLNLAFSRRPGIIEVALSTGADTRRCTAPV